MTNGIPDSILELPDDEQDAMRAEADREAHPPCVVCDREVCLWRADGTVNVTCYACDLDNGEYVDGGAVHDACKEVYTLKSMAHDIEAALCVRLPLGMEAWAVERAANIAIIMYHGYVKPKEKR